MILALSLVPPDKIEECLDALATNTPTELQPILNYFEDTYIGRPQRTSFFLTL